jgi:hypothetical protein
MAGKPLASGSTYAGKRRSARVKVLTMDAEAVELLHHYAPPGKRLGAFVSRLLYEHHARQEARKEERERLQRQLAEVAGGEEVLQR